MDSNLIELLIGLVTSASWDGIKVAWNETKKNFPKNQHQKLEEHINKEEREAFKQGVLQFIVSNNDLTKEVIASLQQNEDMIKAFKKQLKKKQNTTSINIRDIDTKGGNVHIGDNLNTK